MFRNSQVHAKNAKPKRKARKGPGIPIFEVTLHSQPSGRTKKTLNEKFFAQPLRLRAVAVKFRVAQF